MSGCGRPCTPVRPARDGRDLRARTFRAPSRTEIATSPVRTCVRDFKAPARISARDSGAPARATLIFPASVPVFAAFLGAVKGRVRV